MDIENATEELDTSTDRLQVGDKLWVEVGRNGVAENPFEKGHDQIHVYGDTTASRDEVFVEVVEIPGEVRAEVIHKSESENNESMIANQSREKATVWRGTEQDIDREQAKNRSELVNKEDIRGSKNDLLDGHL